MRLRTPRRLIAGPWVNPGHERPGRTTPRPGKPAQAKPDQAKPPLGCITGATSGIGLGFARELARRGYRLLLCGRRREILETRARELEGEFGTSVALSLGDLTDPAYRRELIRTMEADLPSVLVLNAGFGTGSNFTQVPLEVHNTMLDLHSRVPMEICRALVPGMVARGSGSIIAVSSLASISPMPGNGVYSGSKAFVNQFMRSLGMELWDQPVVVQSLLPGFTYTDFHSRMETWTMERKNRGLIRWQTPDQVAKTSLNAPKHRLQVIPGWSNRLLFNLSRFIPQGIYHPLAARATPDTSQTAHKRP